MASFTFDWSAFKPMMDSLNQAYQFQVGRLPSRAAMEDQAYKEWLRNQEFKRGLEAMKFQSGVAGQQAADALNRDTLFWNTLPQRQAYDVANNMSGAGVHHFGPIGTQIAGTAYGGSSPGGVESAKLGPIPYLRQPDQAMGPTVNVSNVTQGGGASTYSGGGGGGQGVSFKAMGGGADIGGFGSGNYWNMPDYWDTETEASDRKRKRR